MRLTGGPTAGRGAPPRLVTTAADAIEHAEFAAAMRAFLPFETCPAVAVAVSGGRDSMALALLAADWVATVGGNLVAFTVDHRLRPESTAEARRVAGWLAARGIAHETLVRTGPRPPAGLQAAAREARYRLLEAACVAHGILHLMFAHQRDDQHETWRMRRARQSSGVGLAGMSAVRETAGLRILRPLLAFPRERLAATLQARGQAWIDDPTNEDAAYERSRLRVTRHGAADVAATERALATAAMSRVDAEAALARAAARWVSVLPQGYARIVAAGFVALEPALREAVLARCVTTVAGRIYPPRGRRLARLAADIAAGGLGRGRTLGGCRIMPEAGTRGAALLVVREAAAIAGDVGPVAGQSTRWDGRFAVGAASDVASGLRVAALGYAGQRQVAGSFADVPTSDVPVPARTSLPVVWCAGTPIAVPHLALGSDTGVSLRFVPRRALTDAGFVVSTGGNGGI